jgi:hypothetical protein
MRARGFLMCSHTINFAQTGPKGSIIWSPLFSMRQRPAGATTT